EPRPPRPPRCSNSTRPSHFQGEEAMYTATLRSVLVVALTTGLLAAEGGRAAAPVSAAEQPAREQVPVVRSTKSGPWSAADTWEGGKVPPAGAKVQIRTGHTVTYDVKSEQTIRSVHV